MPLGLSDNLFKRIISALSLLPIVLGAIYLGGWWFFSLLAVGGYLMISELLIMLGQVNRNIHLTCTISTLVICLPIMMLDLSKFLQVLYLLSFVSFSTLVLTVYSPRKLAAHTTVKKEIAVQPCLTATAYVGMTLLSFIWMRTLDANGLLVIWLFFAVWAMDVGGYFAGKGLGGPKLAPKISPNKTWTGLFGGMLLAAIISVFITVLFDLGTPTHFAISGAVVALVAQIGDLYESAIKRHLNVKDSGVLIPGHGGILDRVDGLVFAAPFTAVIIAMTFLINGNLS